MRRLLFAYELLISLCVAQLLLSASDADAGGPFETSGDARWIVFASRQNVDEAIGLARRYGSDFGPPQVMSTTNGWYAITVGPLRVPDSAGLKKKVSTSWWVPKDAFFTKGQIFVDRIWQAPKSPVLANASTEDGKPRVALADGVEARVVAEGNRLFVLVRSEGGTVKISFDDAESPNTSAGAVLARLDSASPLPQVVATSFSGGAHCCTEMKIATLLDNRWRIVDVGKFDVDGPGVDDLNGDGHAELVGKDDSFDYAFNAYSMSYAPPKIVRLAGTKIVNVSAASEFQRALRQMLLGVESTTSPDQWKDNGFIGGWVAHKALIGEGADGWRRMLTLYDRTSDWDLSPCTVEMKLGEQCPPSAVRQRDFPTALREHLAANGYSIAGILDAPTGSFSPSFDCNKAKTATEHRICESPRLAELDNILAAGYGFIKTARGRPAADAIGIPFWRIIGQCEGTAGCIAQHQVEEISAFAMAGAPVALPAWAAPTAVAPVAPGPSPTATVTPVVAKPEEPKPSPAPLSHGGSSGTGFFVTADGDIVTNAHVVEDCSTITVRMNGGDTATARMLARDARNDLALLKAGVVAKKVAGFRTSIRQGEGVEAFGYPLTFVLATAGNFTLGNVSALAGLGDDSRYVQISVPVQPGNSGGGLLDQAGNVVGVVSAKIDALKMMIATNGDIPQNVNFAIKASIVENFLDSNGVTYSTGTATQQMQPADIADQARAMSVFIECR